MLVRVLQLAYFMAPAYVANMAPPFVRYWKGWNRPISRRWLGTHKTVLGFVLGVVAATLTTFVQWLLAWSGSLVAYEDWPLLGVLFGAGAMAGDSAKSFFKRRLGVEPGRPWIRSTSWTSSSARCSSSPRASRSRGPMSRRSFC